MPIRNPDPFKDPTAHLKTEINPFVDQMRDPELPIVFGENLRGRAGHWNEDRNKYKNLFVEIGSYKGKTLVEMAADYPEDAFVGIDITFKRVVSAAKRARKWNLKNVQSVLAHMNAQSIKQLFATEEIDMAMIFFPDPWTKKKQQKNRIISPEFCVALKEVIRIGGFLWFKTDHLPYFEDATAMFAEAGYRRVETLPFHTERYETPFEKTFKNQGLPTYSSYWQRP